jgi:heptaprenyl diphosphate synthase
VKQFDQFRRVADRRARRRQVYEEFFSAQALFIAGFLIMPALLFNPVVNFRILQFLFFWFLAWLSGKKNKPLFTFLVMLGIVIFNLILPYGQVLFSIGVFKITSGALMTGINRAVTLEGLIMLSRFTIRQDLKIPGLFGELIGESFRIFAVIMSQKRHITRKNLIADIDRFMLDLSGDSAETSQPAGPGAPESRTQAYSSSTKPAGFVVLAAVVILSWLPWVVFLVSQTKACSSRW